MMARLHRLAEPELTAHKHQAMSDVCQLSWLVVVSSSRGNTNRMYMEIILGNLWNAKRDE